jgi:hypothetical protein
MDGSNAPAVYPSNDDMIARADELYLSAGGVPPSLQRWADGVDVTDHPELWTDRSRLPHRGMNLIIWGRIRRDDDGLIVDYAVNGAGHPDAETAARTVIPAGWTLVGYRQQRRLF